MTQDSSISQSTHQSSIPDSAKAVKVGESPEDGKVRFYDIELVNEGLEAWIVVDRDAVVAIEGWSV